MLFRSIGAAWMAKYHRLAALALVGGTGIVTAATFLWLSAPDLALTQLMVETVTTVLILLGLRWLPRRIEGVSPLPGSLDRARAPEEESHYQTLIGLLFAGQE